MRRLSKKKKSTAFIAPLCQSFSFFVASHTAVLRGSSRVPAQLGGAGTRDEPLRPSAWEATEKLKDLHKGAINAVDFFLTKPTQSYLCVVVVVVVVERMRRK